MRISGLELIEIRLPLREPFTASFGSRSHRRILLLRVEGCEREEGWGECVAGEDPSYSYETTETAWHILNRFILPALLGREIQGPEELAAVSAAVRGHPMAKATVEMAVWDLQAKEIGVPLWELLGGSGAPIPVGVSVGIQPDDDALLRKADEYLARGYARVKLKIKPGRDVDTVRAVRERFPAAQLSVDANAAYTLADASRLKELDAFDLLMVEQPLGHQDFADHARLQELLDTPICLDESIRSEGDARLALELGACQVVSVKPGPVGGLAGARAIHNLCDERGVPAWCGGMLESGIGRAHNLCLATLPGFSLPGDISESRRYWDRDIVNPEFTLDEGRMTPLVEPGIGVEPDRDRIRRLAVRHVAYGRLDRPVVEAQS